MILGIFYPNSETTKEIIITSSTVGGLVYLLLIIYQPFGTSQFEHPYKYVLLFPYAIISTFSFCSVNFFFTKNKEGWTVGLELLKIFWIILSISILSYFYNCLFLSKVSMSFENFLYMFLYTSSLGLPVSAIYVMARYIYLNNKKKAAVTSEELNKGFALETTTTLETKECDTRLHIVADYGHFHIDIDKNDFVFAEAVDNYCFIHFYRNGIIQKEIIRISLTKLLDQIQSDEIRRVHRSFIVNLKKVKKYKGNASGYKISLEDIHQELVVARSYIDSIIPLLKNFVIRP